MEQRTILRRFRWRLLGQALVRSVIWGLTAGAAALGLCSLVWHLLIKTMPMLYAIGSAAGGFLIGFLPCMFMYFPTKRRTAARLDRTGLQERVGTMLQYSGKAGLLVEMQRQDAMERITRTSAKKLKLQLSKKELISCAVAVIVCATMLLIPYDLLAPPPEKPEEVTAWESRVHTMIDDLRQQIQDSYLTPEEQAALEAILAQLEQDLLATDSQLEQAALIQQAQEEIQDTLYGATSRRQIGRALQQYDLTTGLGAQFCTDYPWEISGPMDKLLRDVTSPTLQITKLANNVNNALEISGVENTDALYCVIGEFAQGLIDLTNTTEGPDDTPTWEMKDLEFLFQIMEERIIAVMDQQMHDEAEMANMDSMITNSLQSLLGEEGTENDPQQGGQKQQGGGQSNQSPQSDGKGDSGGTPAGGLFDDGGLPPERTTMLEGIYDPLSGDVTYGEVFAAYYAQYLQALDNGEVPEDLREYFEKYFSSLS